ncbi:hypothetical protein TrRE_jg8126 [Triparma retinervis]|uniref:Thiamine pyrimidine synthase n=1 Tax=Triparma retinervis TaxID=2557542 RepID=A0A9W6ZY63_9STRA|nr:hypothetical protein TrRE_jg8126 [Triparma retinervis]
MARNKIVSLAIAFCANANNTGDSGIFGSAIKLFQTTHKHLLHPSYDGRISDEARKSLKTLVYHFYEYAVFPALLYTGNDDDEEWSWGDLNPLEFLPPNNKFVPVPPFGVWLQKRGDNISGMEIMSDQIKEEVDLVDVKRWDAHDSNTRGPCILTGQSHGFVSIEHTIVNVISTNWLSIYVNMGIEPLRNNSVDLRNVAKEFLKTVRVAKTSKPGQVHLLGGDAYEKGRVCYLCGKEIVRRENLGYFEDFGLDVEVIEPADHWDADKEILAGNLDIATTEPLHLAQDAAQGKSVLGFSRFFHTDGGVMYLDSSGITRPKDMCGKTIQYPGSPGPGGPAIVQTMVEADGGVCDVESYGKFNNGFYHTDALKGGNADVATLMFYNFEMIEAEQKGLRANLYSMVE